MADEVPAIEKPAEKATRVDMMKKLLTKVSKTASKVKKDLEKQLGIVQAIKPKESMESAKEKLIACSQAVKKAKKDMASKQ